MRFARETFAGLVDARERLLEGNKTDLRMFGRLDISVIQLEDGKRDFFVNEIKMGHTANLFFRHVPKLVGPVSEEFATALRDKGLSRRDGYLI